ncbi:MAG: NAD(P)/FAD-dependent oxidoreductase [Burkholderiales bacterium]
MNNSAIPQSKEKHRVIIVGGGAGGLELATRLGNSLGKKNIADVTLVDKNATHLWKPLLHEVAAGSMDIHAHQLDYLAQARWHHFNFRLGALQALDRTNRQIRISALIEDDGEEILPVRTLHYDTLVICIGSTVNDFGIPGVAQHALALDTAEQAEKFHRKLVAACVRVNAQKTLDAEVNVVIIGAGATGVELSAELRNTTDVLASYGLNNLNPAENVKLTIIEAAARVLPPLPERVAESAHELLLQKNIGVLVNEKVTEVTSSSVHTASGKNIHADLIVWAAGIKAPDILATLDGLETNRINQLIVQQTLATTLDANIFSFGDCASCPWPEKSTPDRPATIPPRAQSAHQQASHLVKSIKSRINGSALTDFHYQDFGSLVSFGDYKAVGSLMGKLIGGSMFIEGLLARIMYVSLYKLHLIALHGYFNVVLDTAARFLKRRTEQRVKLD